MAVCIGVQADYWVVICYFVVFPTGHCVRKNGCVVKRHVYFL